MRVASEVVLLSTGDWTQVYIDGRNSGIGTHYLGSYEWAMIIEEAQPIESIVQREFISRADAEFWPHRHEWPKALADVPESELQAPDFLLNRQGLRAVEKENSL